MILSKSHLLRLLCSVPQSFECHRHSYPGRSLANHSIIQTCKHIYSLFSIQFKKFANDEKNNKKEVVSVCV